MVILEFACQFNMLAHVWSLERGYQFEIIRVF
ncbi:hypothetical protein AERO8C_70492 [Aeromonas veronii]|uniref:Uncharacterized protein n=1 Tax=Aeromonas veronii TaxID=654 RepID=A0A653LC86_AERVE|nr:hypothetical protein AERO8C_70492 [Aeromonas veronii]